MARNGKQGGSARKRKASATPSACVVVAAAPAGREALTQLFTALRAPTGATFVVSVRRDESVAGAGPAMEAIRTAGDLTVEPASDGLLLRPDCVYVAGDAEMVTVHAGRLR